MTFMLVDPQRLRSKIDQLKLSYEGYRRQLRNLTLSEERRMRLEAEVEVLSGEIATLEKVAAIVRVEPDRAKVEVVVRDRLAEVRRRLAEDSTLDGLSPEARDNTSGEVRALLWALGEDEISRGMREVFGDNLRSDPSRLDAALPAILINGLRTGADENTRASAAYELGVLHATEAIPDLAAAMSAGGIVGDMALVSLRRFSDEELSSGGLPPDVIARVRE